MLAFPFRTNRSILDPDFEDDLFSRPLTELLSPFLDQQFRARNLANCPARSVRSKPKQPIDNTKFNCNLDLSCFEPSEISVKYDEGQLMVNAKHEKSDDGHYEYREFVQKCSVPENVISEKLKSTLDNDGILRIEAPLKVDPNQLKSNERSIPIEFAGQSDAPQKT